MKKFYFAIAVAMMNAAALAAQPTLTAATTNPIPGITIQKKFFTPATGQEGAAGAGQTWNWSTLVETMTATGYYVNPSGTPHAAAHPTATVCITDNNGAYEYDLGNGTGFFRLGYYNDNLGNELDFDNSTQILKYPLTYNTTWTDTYGASVITSSLSGTVYGTITVTADAWGTIITPAGTFTNVLRVHTHVEETYDYGIATVDQSADQYNFMSADFHFPVAEVVWGESAGSPYSSASWANVSVGINETNAALFNMNVFPNPVSEKATVTYTLQNFSEVTIQVADLTGRIAETFISSGTNPGTHNIPIDVAGLSNGIYMVTAIIDGHPAISKMVVNKNPK